MDSQVATPTAATVSAAGVSDERLRARQARNENADEKLREFKERLRLIEIETKLLQSCYQQLLQQDESPSQKQGVRSSLLKRYSQLGNIPLASGANKSKTKPTLSRSESASDPIPGNVLSLTLEQKYAMAMNETQKINNEIQHVRKASETDTKLTKALIDESELEIAEIRRDAFEFRRDVVVNGENPRSGATMAEKVLKWIEDRLARKDLQITKLKLRAHHLRQQARAPARRLKSRMESGDDLHYIDFHQLQIENEQFAAKIEEANREVLRQKSICAKTLQSQMQMKQTLQMCVEEAKRLQTQIDERKVLLRKAKIDVQKAVREKDAARNDNKRLHIQSRATLKVPQTLDYVNSRAEEYSLQQQVKTWRRKVEVAELELKRLRARKKDKAKPAE